MAEPFALSLFQTAKWPFLKRLTIEMPSLVTFPASTALAPLFGDKILQGFLYRHPTLEALSIDNTKRLWVDGTSPLKLHNTEGYQGEFLPNLRSLNLPFQWSPKHIPKEMIERLTYYAPYINSSDLKLCEQLRALRICNVSISQGRKFKRFVTSLPKLERLCCEIEKEDAKKPPSRGKVLSFIEHPSSLQYLTHMAGFLVWENLELPGAQGKQLVEALANKLPLLRYVETYQAKKRVWIELQRDQKGNFVSYRNAGPNRMLEDKNWDIFFTGFRSTPRNPPRERLEPKLGLWVRAEPRVRTILSYPKRVVSRFSTN
ncbi:hypothetical protein M422DRAFT_246367 [Sphaerobolus stellatus SS14]|nr:hypothetical protein M422DRAFT_246367 [Sphaerobolus stellatus SS14]